MKLDIPDEIISGARMSEQELKCELAVTLYQSRRLTFGQASELAGMPQDRFMHLLGSRDIPFNYDIEEFNKDLETLERLNAR